MFNQKIFEILCKQKQSNLLNILKMFLSTYYNKIIATEDYIIAEGDIPIALVSHLDTVGLAPPQDIYYDKDQKVMWSPQLLGADDRAGVYAIVNIVTEGYKPHIIFTTDEEIGCIGANKIINEYPYPPFKNLKAIIQLDRRGEKDCVFYGCDNKNFTNFIKSFDFDVSSGSYSDISFIAPKWEIAAVNLSVGYENEHENIELLHTDWLEETIEKVKRILDKGNEIPSFPYIRSKRNDIFDPDVCICCGKPLNGKGVSNEYIAPPFMVCKRCSKKYF